MFCSWSIINASQCKVLCPSKSTKQPLPLFLSAPFIQQDAVTLLSVQKHCCLKAFIYITGKYPTQLPLHSRFHKQKWALYTKKGRRACFYFNNKLHEYYSVFTTNEAWIHTVQHLHNCIPVTTALLRVTFCLLLCSTQTSMLFALLLLALTNR